MAEERVVSKAGATERLARGPVRSELAMGATVTPSPATGPSRELVAGAQVRQYELIRELGRGGMGQVYLARDLRLARRVAIKFLITESRELSERFLVEARMTAMVNHENIVVIHEVDEHDGMPYMVLEYLEGSSLREHLHDRAVTASRAVELAVPIVRALERAHGAGIVHRDLKPENIFLTADGNVKVLDFGIAKALAAPEAAKGRVNPEALAALRNTHLTQHNSLIGTPAYMSPEQIGVDSVDHRSDLWAVGVILFEMLSARHPIEPFSIEALFASAVTLDEPMRRIGDVVADVPQALERIVDRCLAKPKAERYPDAATLLADLEKLLPGRFGRKLREDENPYPGLSAFQEEDADRFFGRSRDISRALARLREQPIVGIAGPSGIGKSSFVRAGIVPALKASGDTWETYIVRPGRKPLASLVAMLAQLQRGTGEGNATGAITEDRLAREPGAFGSVLRARAHRKQARILVFVDQFEELYTLCADPAERRAFTACLAGAADDAASAIRIVVSMRSDFIDRAGEDRDFLDRLTRALIFLQPLGRHELCEALTRPLDMCGYELESDALVERMLDELTAAPGALPLLQFAASRLWEARDRKRKLLTDESHAAMGGIAGALATHADEVLRALPESAHGTVRAVFRKLVTPERTRAIVDVGELRELGPDASGIVDRLVEARLLVAQGESDGGSIEIVHESLIASWPRLRRWLDESEEDAAFLAQLAAAAKQWDQRGRSPDLLWRGDAAREAQAFQGRTRGGGELAARERAYLDAVIALATRAARIKRRVVAGVIALLSLLVVGAGVAMVSIRDAEHQARDQAARANAATTQANSEAARARQAEQKVHEQLDQIRSEQQATQRAENEARTKGNEAAMSKEQLQAALVEAEAAQQRAQTAAEQARDAASKAQAAADRERKTREEAQRLYEAEKAHVKKLEEQGKKITTELR